MKKFKTFLKVLGLFLVILIILAVSYFHILDNYELEALDMRFRLRPKIPSTDKVVVVEIGDDTIKYLGRFPFSRDYHAVIARALAEFGAKAVVFDIFFSEPHSTDKDFEEALKFSGNTYLPSVFELESKSGAIPRASAYAGECLESFLTFARGSGHINVVPDIDGKYRRFPPYIQYGNTFYPQLAVLVACDFLGIKQKEVACLGETSSVRRKYKNTARYRSLMYNYSGDWGRFTSTILMSTYSIVFAKSSGQTHPGPFAIRG